MCGFVRAAYQLIPDRNLVLVAYLLNSYISFSDCLADMLTGSRTNILKYLFRRAIYIDQVIQMFLVSKPALEKHRLEYAAVGQVAELAKKCFMPRLLGISSQ